MSDEVFPFIYVRSDALQHAELLKSPATFLVLCTISLFAKRKKDGSCYFKQDTVAKHLGKSRQAISKSLHALEKMGFIEIIHQTYKGSKTNNAYRILYDQPLKSVTQHDVASTQHDVASKTQHDVASKPVSYKPDINKKTLLRSEFVEEVLQGVKGGEFSDEFNHLDEADIVAAGSAFWDFMDARDDSVLFGKACSSLRTWIRKGIRNGAIRKAAKAKQGARVDVSADTLAEWQKAALSGEYFTKSEFRSWIEGLDRDSCGNFIAPTRFVANYVAEHYADRLTALTGQDFKILVKQREQA